MQLTFKRLFSLAVAIVMVLSMLPAGTLQASAAETAAATHQAHCVCGGSDTHSGCTHAALEGEWKPWDGKSDIAEGGNYYLTQSLTGSTQYWMGGSYKNTTAMTINLCTNGHSIDSNYRVFGIAPYVTFNLMNCSDTLSVLQGCSSGTDSNGAIHMHAATCEFNLYDNIKIVGKNVSGRNTANAGVLGVPGTFNMYGSELVGKTVSNAGGVLYITTGTVNLYDGKISGGKANWGGNVAMNGANSKLNMYGGSITGGVATMSNEHGGNLYLYNGSQVLISGGLIADGKSTNTNDANGGNIAVVSANSKLTINGTAKILGGQANRGANIFLHTGAMEIGGNAYIGAGRAVGGADTTATGGGYAPGILVNGTAGTECLTITGNPTVEHLYVYMNNATVGGKVKFDNLGANAKLNVVMNVTDSKLTNTAVSADVLDRITCGDIARQFTQDADGNLVYTAKDIVQHCVCGDPTSTGNPCAEGGHQVVTWQPWTDTGTLPFVSGYWYLPTDLNFPKATAHTYYSGFATSTAVIGLKQEGGTNYDTSVVTEAQHVYVDLNGKTVTAKAGHRIFRLEPNFAHTLTVTDSVGYGRLNGRSTDAGNAQGLIFWGRHANHVVNVYGGIMDARDGKTTQAGLGGTAAHTGQFNFYGGTMYAGVTSAATGGGIKTAQNVLMTGDFTLYGGEGTSGGAVSVEGSSTLTMSGNAKIIGGYSGSTGGYGGGGVVLNSGSAKLNMSGNAQIIGDENRASPNGAVFVAGAGAKVTLSDNASITAPLNAGVMLVSGAKLYVGANGLQNAKINVASQAPASGLVLVDSANLKEEDAACFTLGNENYTLEYTSSGMKLYEEVIHCVCGDPSSTGNPCADAGHKQVTWKPWLRNDVTPFLDGYWYLPNDLDLTNSTFKYVNHGIGTTPTALLGVDMEGNIVGKAVNVYIDLNGKTITGKAWHRVFRVENDYAHNLTITDSVGGGQIIAKSPATSGNSGMIIWTRNAGSNVTIYGGKLDASQALGKLNGGALSVCSPVYIYGGEIIGSTGITGYGGAIYATGATAHIYNYGGTITGGHATTGGGNICLTGGAKLTMTDGIIENGTVIGGHGGNITMQNSCTATITGGIIRNGEASPAENAATTNKDAWDKNGGNIAVVHNTTADVRTVLTLGGNVQVEGGKGDRGGSIFVHSGELIIKDQASVTGGIAKKSEYGYADSNAANNIHVNRNRTGSGDKKFIAKVSVSGTPTIGDITYTDAIDATGLKAGASIVVNRLTAASVTTAAVSAEVAKCFSSANADYHIEQREDGIVYYATHTFVSTDCEQDGVCSCGATTPAIGHNRIDKPGYAADCENDGLTDGVYCDVCNTWVVPQTVIPAKGHAYDEGVIDPKPTCNDAGTKTFTCANCGDSYTEAVDALGHNKVDKPGYAADCENDGLTDGVYCDVCNTWIVPQTVIPAKGHNKVDKPGYAADCENDGLTDGVYCDVCDTWIVPQTVIPAKGHNKVDKPGYAADCENDGLTDGVQCSVCNTWIVPQTVIPAKGHTYTTYIYNEDATVYADGTETAACDNGCGTTHTRTAEGTKLTAVAKNGEKLYTTLAAAVAEAEAGATVELLCSTSGKGMVISKNLTIDFGGYTYSFTEGVGSTGTASNGLQILAGNEVNLKNGTLEVAAEAADKFYILVQNYADLTVIDMTLDGTNLDKWAFTDGDSYTLSNNSGAVNILGATNIIANNDGDLAFAFDVCDNKYYASKPVVNVNTTGTITGAIEVSATISENLNILGGTFTVPVEEAWCAGGFIPTVNADGTYGVKAGKYVAMANGQKFETLAEAVAAAEDGSTVTLLCSTSGAGMVIGKNITIDFGGYTYSFTEGVGSTGTASNGLQILAGNEVNLKNGTLEVAAEAADKFYILVQNYADLTVIDMTLDGTNLDKWAFTDGDSYTLSNNSGAVNILGATNIIANNDGDLDFAFDVCDSKYYASKPVVNVNTTGTITGAIEVSATISENLNILGGTFTVPVEEAWCAGGFIPTVNADGTYGVKAGKYVAMANGQKFETLAEAVAAAEDGSTVTLLCSTSGAGMVIGKNLTIDFGGYTYSFTEGVGSTGTASNGLQILAGNEVNLKNGTLEVAAEAADKFYILVQNYADLTVIDMTLDGTNLDKWALTDGDSYTLSNNSGAVNILGATNIIANNDGDLAFAFDVCDSKYYASKPVVNVNTTGTITGAIEVSATISENLNILGGTFTVPVEEAWCAAGFHPVETNGVYTVAKHSYQIEVTDPTCVDAGYTTHTCSCGDTFVTDPVDALGHNEIDKPGYAADCENDGLTDGVYCDVCNTWLVPQTVIPAKGHNKIDKPGYAADCVNEGLTDGVYCDVCNTWIVPQTVIPALGHSYTNYISNGDATLYADGTETASCDRNCGATDTRVAEGSCLAVAKIGDVHYAVLAEALQAAYGSNATVTLLKNVSEYSVMVPAGATLDLNGYDLTANYVTAVGGIVDATSEGLLKTAQGNAFLFGQTALPIWNGEGYYFVSKIKLNENTDHEFTRNGDAVSFVFIPWFTGAIRNEFADGAADNGLQLKVRLTWNGANGPMTQDVNFNDIFVEDVYDDYRQAFRLTISNAATLDGLTFQIVLLSDTKAEFVSDAFVNPMVKPGVTDNPFAPVD